VRGEGIDVIPYSPGRRIPQRQVSEGQPLPDSQRAGNAKRYMTGWGSAPSIIAVASAHSVSMAAVALAWQMTRPAVTGLIIGANPPEQLAALLPASELRLSADEVRALDAASAGRMAFAYLDGRAAFGESAFVDEALVVRQHALLTRPAEVLANAASAGG
jgi:aryl-alcohol dehydrogenase-like predicted oxidoreductase